MILLDGDQLAYQTAAGVLSGQGDYMDLMETLFSRTMRWIEDCGHRDNEDVVVCMSSPDNFRKGILPEYKANRKETLDPQWRKDAEMMLEREFYCKRIPGLEGDDVMGILATQPGADAECWLASYDKDMLQIPGYHWNPMKQRASVVSAEQGIYSFHMQWLTGDSSDNYKGIPKVGPVKAANILRAFIEEIPELEESFYDWQAAEDGIVGYYRERGLSDEYCLQMARCAYILRAENLTQTSQIIHFTPRLLVAPK